MDTKTILSLSTLKLEHLLSLLFALYAVKFLIYILKLIIKFINYIVILFIIVRIVLDLSSTEGGFSNYKFEEFRTGLANIINPLINVLKNIAINTFTNFSNKISK
jgi:hypothetical protein